MMHSHLTFSEAIVVGLTQGVAELFPLSSLGHNVLIPALIGGGWAQDLNVSKPESPYLVFIVGTHVTVAIAMIIYLWRSWLRIIIAFFGSIRHVVNPAPGTRRFQPQTTDQKLSWMIIWATIPIGIAGLLLEHTFRVYLAKPTPTAVFLAVNGLILFARERLRRQQIRLNEQRAAEDIEMGAADGKAGTAPRHVSGQRAAKERNAGLAMQADRRLARIGWLTTFGLGASQILALLPGISRDGMIMVSGMFRGLSRRDAARLSFLLSAPVILAAGVLKLPDLAGPIGNGIRIQVLVGSVLSGVCAYLSLRFFMRYLSNSKRTLIPFGVYCLVVGIGSAIYFGIS